MTLKQLYQLHEMSLLRQSIGREEVLPPHRFPDAEPGSLNATYRGRSQERIAIGIMIWQRLDNVFERIYGTKAIYIEDDMYEGAEGFIAIWDHFQKPLRGTVSQRNGHITARRSWSSIFGTTSPTRRYSIQAVLGSTKTALMTRKDDRFLKRHITQICGFSDMSRRWNQAGHVVGSYAMSCNARMNSESLLMLFRLSVNVYMLDLVYIAAMSVLDLSPVSSSSNL